MKNSGIVRMNYKNELNALLENSSLKQEYYYKNFYKILKFI